MTSKCRWGPSVFPEFPRKPSSCPRLTNSPRSVSRYPFEGRVKRKEPVTHVDDYMIARYIGGGYRRNLAGVLSS